MPEITFATIALNEADYLPLNLRQHYDLCDRWIIVEGACRGYPNTRVSTCGYSTDGTREAIEGTPDPDNKIEHIRHGWTDAFGEDAKSELRNRYADIARDGVLLVIDADEFYRREDLRMVLDAMSESEFHCWRLPQVHFWHGTHQIVTGGYWNVEHNRLYRWKKGLIYWRNHNHPEQSDGQFWHEVGPYKRTPRRLQKTGDGITHHGPCCYHFGFAKPPQHMRDKQDFYNARGERATRPGNTRCREAWFTGELPEGCHVMDWDGPLPEVFESR